MICTPNCYKITIMNQALIVSLPFASWLTSNVQAPGVPQDIPLLDEWIALFPGLVLKPVYMAVSLLLFLFLRNHRGSDMVFMRWALVVFFTGEFFRGINNIFFAGKSDFFEIIHGLGMVGFGTLLAWALFTLFDERVLHFTPLSRSCTLQRICQVCWKFEETTCGLKRLFMFMAPCLGLITMLPLAVPLKTYQLTLNIFDTPVEYQLSPLISWMEFRVFPFLGAILLLLTPLFLAGGPDKIKRGHYPFFLGLGLMIYSLSRFFLVSSFQSDPQWTNFWEEFTELLTVLGIAVFLYIFRQTLGVRFKLKQTRANGLIQEKTGSV